MYGVCCGAFCDFGDHFEITDMDGEEPKEIFIEKISKVTGLLSIKITDELNKLYQMN